jgi:tRNA nucleotidyltransferase (CCA-adding enzyme)
MTRTSENETVSASDWIPAELVRILAETPELRRAYLVGGCVRDWLWGREGLDYDVEVYGIPYAGLVTALSRWGRVDLVGRSFGVAKLTLPGGRTYDFTVPRRDSKVGRGHKGFEVEFDPEITPERAAARRDFTINALMFDPRRGELLDPVGGEADLRGRILRHTSPAFVEDPLRVLRGMQFLARFDLRPAAETVTLCRAIQSSHGELARERIWDEWLKWASRGGRPSAGLHFLREAEWLIHYPELLALAGTPQDPEWHPEGDVFVHTCHCCDALAESREWQAADAASRAVYMLAVLTHDTGKPATTHAAERDGVQRIVSPGHEEAGGIVTETFLERIHAPRAIRERVLPLVTNHMAHLQTVTGRMVRRLARRLEPENIEGLTLVIMADAFGRPPLPRVMPRGLVELRSKASELAVETAAPKPILRGRDLLERGWRPGPAVGAMVQAAYEAQLEGQFRDREEALRWLDQRTDPAPGSETSAA